jgi:hypothetical protein
VAASWRESGLIGDEHIGAHRLQARLLVWNMETVYCLKVTPLLLFGNYVRQTLIISTLWEGRQARVIFTYPP